MIGKMSPTPSSEETLVNKYCKYCEETLEYIQNMFSRLSYKLLDIAFSNKELGFYY